MATVKRRDHPLYIKYYKMLAMGLTMPMVQQRMRHQDGVDQDFVDKFPTLDGDEVVAQDDQGPPKSTTPAASSPFKLGGKAMVVKARKRVVRLSLPDGHRLRPGRGVWSTCGLVLEELQLRPKEAEAEAVQGKGAKVKAKEGVTGAGAVEVMGKREVREVPRVGGHAAAH